MNKHPAKKVRLLLLLACIAIWITAALMTHLPPENVPGFETSDKVLHFLGYFVLTGVFELVLWSYGHPRWRRFIIAIVVMILYAIADESSQQLVNRDTAFGDWLANVLGVLTAAGMDMLVLPFVHFRRK